MNIERRKNRHESLIEAEIGTYGAAGATLFKSDSNPAIDMEMPKRAGRRRFFSEDDAEIKLPDTVTVERGEPIPIFEAHPSDEITPNPASKKLTFDEAGTAIMNSPEIKETTPTATVPAVL